MITANDIKIKSFRFDGSLQISVKIIEGADVSIILPATALMESLHQTGDIIEYSFPAEQVRRSFNYPFLSLTQFMKNNLNHDMAERLAVHYLSNRTDKASGNYKTSLL